LSSTACSPEAEAAAEAETPSDPAAELANFDPRQSLAPMIKAAGPAVVAIDAGRVGPASGRFGSNDDAIQGRGSGFVVDDEGLVVTNHHVIAGAHSVKVRLPDGRRFDARVVGSDPATDLALLRLEGAQDLPVVRLGDSGTLEVGDWVVAMGNPMGLDHSATVGIISGKGRGSLGLYRDSYIDFIQTDADIAPGSSGGPLFNLRGEVVGINTAVGAGLRPGFAIPIDQAKRIIEQLRDRGEVVRGWLGAGNLPGATGPGAAIGSTFEGTPAARAGLRAGDVVEEVDGEEIESFEALRARVGTKVPGDHVELLVRRDGEELQIDVTLEARPEEEALGDLRPSRGHSEPEAGRRGGLRLPFGLDSHVDETLRLGITARAVDGALEVVEVREGSLGATLGLRSGDRLRELDGETLRRPADVAHVLSSAGSTIELRFERDGASHVVTFER